MRPSGSDPPVHNAEGTPAAASHPYTGRESVSIPQGSWALLEADPRLLRATLHLAGFRPPRRGKWKVPRR